jgi:hypothetical protein
LLVMSTLSSVVFSSRPLPQLPCTGTVAFSNACSTARSGPTGGLALAVELSAVAELTDVDDDQP